MVLQHIENIIDKYLIYQQFETLNYIRIFSQKRHELISINNELIINNKILYIMGKNIKIINNKD